MGAVPPPHWEVGGGCSKFDGGGLESMHGLKLLAISLQACKFTKNERLHTFFQGFQLDFKLLFVLFLGIIS